ncbi:MAG: DUF2190 family protein [Reyranellaceae bacterium]
MKNYVQPGKTVTVTAPYAVASGAGCQVGSLFGVAATAVDNGATDLEIVTEGVFDLVKVGSQAWTAGQKVYWDDGNKRCTGNGAAGMLIGVATQAVADGADDTTGRVRLNGAAPATAEGPQAAIADLVAITGGEAPTEAEHNLVVAKVNEIVAALETAGIIASA